MADIRKTFNISEAYSEIVPHLDKQKNLSRYICDLVKKDIEHNENIQFDKTILNKLDNISDMIKDLKKYGSINFVHVDDEEDDKVLVPDKTIITPDETQKRAVMMASFDDDDF